MLKPSLLVRRPRLRGVTAVLTAALTAPLAAAPGPRAAQTPPPGPASPPSRAPLAEAIKGPLAGVRHMVYGVTEKFDRMWTLVTRRHREPADHKGAPLCKLDLHTGGVTLLLDDPKGHERDLQVHYEGRKAIFAYRKGVAPGTHLHEINLDGTGLKRITPEDRESDIRPTYLPSGDIIFASTRSRRYVACAGSYATTLFRCRGDGSRMFPISSSLEHERGASVLADGRIIFHDWDYDHRGTHFFMALFTSHPDGTGLVAAYGNMHANYKQHWWADWPRQAPGGDRITLVDRADASAGPVAVIDLAGGPGAPAADQPQWGQGLTRNMVSDERGLAETFDPAGGRNILWSVPLGSETYSTPVVAAGRVLIGTNNAGLRDPRLKGDRGVMLCLDEKNGRLIWQLATPKRGPSNYWDWPNSGNCSPATVEGDRVYTVTNRGEVVCLELDGMANGNDGPFKDEARLAAAPGAAPVEPGPAAADVLWLYDLTKDAGVRQHDAAHSAVLVHGPYLYVNTANGLNDAHTAMEKPDAPSLVVLEKATGRLVAREREGIGRRTFHSTWSSPALGLVKGREQVFFGGGDGVVYAFEALRGPPARDPPARDPPARDPPAALNLVWKHDCDPDAPRDNTRAAAGNRREGPSNIKSMPVFHEGRVYVTYGGDIWWGKQQAWLKCIDATGTGDVTRQGALWRYALKQHCMSTPAVRDGLVYVGDSGGAIHCVEAATGRGVWMQDAGGEVWASPLVADGKVYVGTRRGTFWIMAEGRRKRVLASIRMDSAMVGSPVAANGVLYVATMRRLYAIKNKGSASEATR